MILSVDAPDRAGIADETQTAEQPHYYTFKEPRGWINLMDPGQSWQEWTKTQGTPTSRGWKVFGTGQSEG